MENYKKYIPWIVIVSILIFASIFIIWYFNRPPKLDIIEDYPNVEDALAIDEIICKI